MFTKKTWAGIAGREGIWDEQREREREREREAQYSPTHPVSKKGPVTRMPGLQSCNVNVPSLWSWWRHSLSCPEDKTMMVLLWCSLVWFWHLAPVSPTETAPTAFGSGRLVLGKPVSHQMELQDGSVPRPLGRGYRATARHTLRCASETSRHIFFIISN